MPSNNSFLALDSPRAPRIPVVLFFLPFVLFAPSR